MASADSQIPIPDRAGAARSHITCFLPLSPSHCHPMSHLYDPGYGEEPFRTLCNEHPDESVYPAADFRLEWGPIFHRGRLDGSARVLIIGQDPATHETIVRRILVGEAGQRVQGFLAKLGIERSYVMVNVFLYSVFGQGGGNRHRNDPPLIAYRNRWLDVLILGKHIEAVIGLGGLADGAWTHWKATAAGQSVNGPFVKITHPTFPESNSQGDPAKHKESIKTMLANWNLGLNLLKDAINIPDVARPLVPYGEAFQPTELAEIPEIDVPPGVPPWMRGLKAWATRSGATADLKRATITVTVPKGFR